VQVRRVYEYDSLQNQAATTVRSTPLVMLVVVVAAAPRQCRWQYAICTCFPWQGTTGVCETMTHWFLVPRVIPTLSIRLPKRQKWWRILFRRCPFEKKACGTHMRYVFALHTLHRQAYAARNASVTVCRTWYVDCIVTLSIKCMYPMSTSTTKKQ
jgi:hypothetical protein